MFRDLNWLADANASIVNAQLLTSLPLDAGESCISIGTQRHGEMAADHFVTLLAETDDHNQKTNGVIKLRFYKDQAAKARLLISFRWPRAHAPDATIDDLPTLKDLVQSTPDDEMSEVREVREV